MNWLAKINLTVVANRLGPFRSAMLLVLLISICLYCGYRMGNYYHSYQQQGLAAQNQRLDLLYNEQEQYLRRIHTLEVELEVEKIANQRSLATLKEIEAEQLQAKKELAFYEKVMAPEKQVDGLLIDNVVVTSSESSHHFRFKIMLVQQQMNKRYAKGHLQLVVAGSRGGKPDEIKLSGISPEAQHNFPFNFKYFQLVEGEFMLPENFIPERIGVSAIMPKTKWQSYHRLDESYQWSTIAENDQQLVQVILD